MSACSPRAGGRSTTDSSGLSRPLSRRRSVGEGAASAPARSADRGLAQPVTLLTGASGYVGGRVLRELERSGRPVRCLTRRPEALRGRMPAHTEIVTGDVLDRSSLTNALRGVDKACYLVHSMGRGSDFEELDRRAARTFGIAASEAGVAQIVYLGGLGDASHLSPHLASRQQVGELLRESGVPTVELRASIVIGAGSASFETVRSLVERLPVIVAPRWTETLAQPVSIDEVVAALVAALSLAAPLDVIWEIGGTECVTYAELMREYARQRGLRRGQVRAPFLTPTVARLLLPLLDPAHGRIAAAMVDGLRNETVVRRRPDLEILPPPTCGVSAAMAQALAAEDREFAQRRWCEANAAERPDRFGGLVFGRRMVVSRLVRVGSPPHEAFRPIERIGGDNGWYSASWFWSLRGCLDRVRGGRGLRRGRRDPDRLRVGDAIDFWRVERVEPGRLLRLAAEMKMPGRLWLQFEVATGSRTTTVCQTTIFDPAGYVGRAYWYVLYPVHRWVFGRMLRGISRAAASGRTRPTRKTFVSEREIYYTM